MRISNTNQKILR